MNVHLTLAQPAQSLWQSPILIAAIVTFAGVLLTVIIGTFANFRLAKKRAEFDRELASRKLEDERQARAEARATNLRLRRIDFQRAALVELQECMLALMRQHSLQLIQSDENAEIDEVIRAHNGRSALLVSRLDNRKIADTAEKIKRTLNGGLSATKEERQSDHTEAALLLVDFLKNVGEEIRRLDRDETSEAGN